MFFFKKHATAGHKTGICAKRYVIRSSYVILVTKRQKSNLKKFSPPTDIRNIARWVAPTLKMLKIRRDKIGPEPERPRSSYLDWNYDAELFAFGPRLNESFEKDLLLKAVTNRSYLTCGKPEHELLSREDNSELAHEGERLIATCIGEFLNANLPKFPADGKRAVCDHLTTESMLSNVAKHLGVKDIVLCAEFPVSESTLAATFKAIVAALFRSSGPERTANFVKDFVITQLNGTDLDEIWLRNGTAMEILTAHFSKTGRAAPEPRLCTTSGTNTILAVYRVALYDDGSMIGIGWGESIEIATDVAARNALQRIFGTEESTLSFEFTNYSLFPQRNAN